MDQHIRVMLVAEENGTRPGCRFYHINDGWHYHLNVSIQNFHYFKCISRVTGCQGGAMYNSVDGFIHTHSHNHAPDLIHPDEMALRNAILDRCRQLDYLPYRRIMDEEFRKFPPEAVARVTYARMLTPMRNARREQLPARYIQVEQFPSLNEDIFYIPKRGAQ